MKGIEVKAILKKQGLTITGVAEMLGESQQNLNSMLSKDDIRTGLLERISEATGLPIAMFYGDSAINANLGNYSSAVTGNNIQVNTSTGEFLKELAAQRKLTEKSQEQIDRLLGVIEKLSD